MKKKKNSKKSQEKAGFDLTFIRRFCFIVFTKLGFFSPLQLFLFVAVFVISLLQAFVKNEEYFIVGEMYVILSEQDIHKGWQQLLRLFLFFCVDVFFDLIIFSIQYCYQYMWRKKLTKKLLNSYFEEKNYYVILHMKEHKIDNPPQRIHSDSSDFCENLALVTTKAIQSLVQIAFNTAFVIQSGAYLMLTPLFLWPIFNIIVIGILFTPISKQIWKKDKLEGTFRFFHARIREHSESISFFKSDDLEKKKVENVFLKLIRALVNLSLRFTLYNGWITITQTIPAISYLTSMFVIVMLNFPPFKASMDAAEITRVCMVVYQTVFVTGSSISVFFSLSNNFTVVMGSTARVGELCEAFKEIKKERVGGVFIEDNSCIQFHNVEIRTPNDKLLLDKFTYKIEKGRSVILMGESGCGKSSLLRVLAGLWKIEHGIITKPFKIGKDGMFFLPQKPYLIKGSLKMNVVYPLRVDDVNCSDDKLESILELAQIGYLTQRASLHEKCVNWDEKLSIGEQQRVGIARLLFHKPTFAVCDESTSALDTITQEKVFENLIKMGITLVSVAHRKTVVKYHKQIIFMKNDKEGGYEIKDVKKEMFPSKKYRWVCTKEYKANEEEKKDFEITNIIDVEKDDKNIGNTGFNLTFLKRLWRLLFGGIMIKRWTQWVLLLFAILITGSIGISSFPFTYLSALLMGNIIEKNVLDASINMVFSSLLLFYIVMSTTLGLLSFMLLGIIFRNNITKYLHSRYFSNQLFYKFNVFHKSIDNPDQRICNDVDSLTSGFEINQGASYLTFSYIISIVTLVMSIISAVYAMGFVGIASCFVVIIIAILLQAILMVLMAKYRFIQQKREGYYRISLERLKEYSEQICFYNGIEREKEIIISRFNSVMKNQLILFLLSIANSTFLSIMFAISKILSMFVYVGGMSIGIFNFTGQSKQVIIAIVQTGIESIRITIFSVQKVMEAGGMLSNCVGNLGRVFQLIEKMESLEKERIETTKERHHYPVSNEVIVDKLTCQLPNMKKLYFNLSFNLKKNDNLLVKGPSGCGKSSLLRMMGNMWPIAKGNVGCPNIIGFGGMFFCPQKPYVLLSGLKQNIIYPDKKSKFSDNELLELLKKVNLRYIYERLGSWNEQVSLNTILSEGEKQRLAFARVLYHKPLFAILDESTSALDEKNEKRMHVESVKNGTNFLSVGHRESIEEFHNKLLEFDGKGNWKFFEKESHKLVNESENEILIDISL